MMNDECGMMNDERTFAGQLNPTLHSSFRIHHFFSVASVLLSFISLFFRQEIWVGVATSNLISSSYTIGNTP
jgi:hypothetical protein